MSVTLKVCEATICESFPECCETLFHRRCFSQMLTHTSRCPACRHENEPENPRALELPDDLDLVEVDLEEAESQLLVFNDPEGTFATIRSRLKSLKRSMSIDFAVYPSRTDEARRFGTFYLILSLTIIFLPICIPLSDLFKSMWVIHCICTAL